eukprot:gene31192-39155_t
MEASIATLVSDTSSSDSDDLDADEAAQEQQVCAVRPVTYSCFKKEKHAAPAAPGQMCSSGENNETEQRSCGEDDETEQRSSGEAKQTKQTTSQATPPDEEDAEEVPQWIWDELTELNKAYADVV